MNGGSSGMWVEITINEKERQQTSKKVNMLPKMKAKSDFSSVNVTAHQRPSCCSTDANLLEYSLHTFKWFNAKKYWYLWYWTGKILLTESFSSKTKTDKKRQLLSLLWSQQKSIAFVQLTDRIEGYLRELNYSPRKFCPFFTLKPYLKWS